MHIAPHPIHTCNNPLARTYWQPGWRLVEVPQGLLGEGSRAQHCVAVLPPASAAAEIMEVGV